MYFPEGINEVAVDQVYSVLPKIINHAAQKYGEINFSLFKATMSKGKVKLIPHGHLRAPYLINNFMLSDLISLEIAADTKLDINIVRPIVESVAINAKSELEKGHGSSFRINGLCRIYVDNGKIRVSTRK